jgi:hypothetical protein
MVLEEWEGKEGECTYAFLYHLLAYMHFQFRT